jgi:hypothetical protein
MISESKSQEIFCDQRSQFLVCQLNEEIFIREIRNHSLECFRVPICDRNSCSDSFFFKSFQVRTILAVATKTILLKAKAIAISGTTIRSESEGGGGRERIWTDNLRHRLFLQLQVTEEDGGGNSGEIEVEMS